MYTFRLRGKMYHISSPLLPTKENESPSYNFELHMHNFFQDPDYDMTKLKT